MRHKPRMDERDPARFPLVEVSWWDHISVSGWHTQKDALALRPPECRDVGRLLCKTKKSLVLAATVASDGDVNNIMVIPRAWAFKVRRLR